VPTLEWRGGVGGTLVLLAQTELPERTRRLRIRDVDAAVAAIRRLDVRGAPAIGCAAAYSMVLALRSDRLEGGKAVGRGAVQRRAFDLSVDRAWATLAASRPTAVNLFWALDRMRRVAKSLDVEALGRRRVLSRLLDEARAIHREDAALCEAIGAHGADLIDDGATILTHCNAGALATGGIGTALAAIYRAVADGKRVRVYADETRPLLQGARLTSWELATAGVEVTVICDNAAASLFGRGAIDAVIVGADRIARNGDVANKIGTYGVAVLARAHRVPFWVAAPSTTFDRRIASGKEIPIEIRAEDEISKGFGRSTVPAGVAVYNPAFDVTPARLVTGIITERGVLRPPYGRAIRALLAASGED
jgi:methylthioribose-1-phosphate isomerase